MSQILIIALLLILGILLLIKGADFLVDGASFLAKRFQVSDLAVGLTVVAFGTSTPELVVNTFAAFNGHHDIVISNIVGSNNFNLLFILGLAGLFYPLTVQRSTVWKEIPISFIAAVVLFFLANNIIIKDNGLSRIDGIILLVFFVGFIYYVYKQLGKEKNTETEVISTDKQKSLTVVVMLIIGGLGMLVIGGRLVVDNSVKLAEFLGMSQKLIGLTIVAIGTSLPEFATSMVAAFKRNNDIAVGNIIGSNIFNIFFILGVSSIINPVIFNVEFNIDLLLLGVGTFLLYIAMFSGKKVKLDRWEALILLLIYIAYTTWLVFKEV